MGLVTVRLTAKQPMSDRKLLACKVNSLKAPKPTRNHPWRGWVTAPGNKTPSGKRRAQFIAEAKLRAKKLKKV